MEQIKEKNTEFALGKSKTNKQKVTMIIVLSILAGLLVKLPFWLNLREDYYYNKNIGLIIFTMLMIYFAWQNNLSKKIAGIILGILALCAWYINALPYSESDSILLAGIHMNLLTWSVLGFVFTGNEFRNMTKRISFLKYNADLLILSGLMLIASAMLTAMTIGLFQLIEINIEKFYFDTIVVYGLAALPIVASYIVSENPNLVGKISPLIAKIFSPILLVMLFVYLIAIVFSGKNPYNDREFLIIFNVLILGVMALVLFSIVGSSAKNKYELWILYALTVLTIIVSIVALSAIIFRINEWGFTPNRTAILGSNLLILTHLIIVNIQLFKVMSRNTNLELVEKSIAWYLPAYTIWAALVSFLFPIIFGH